MVQKVQTRSAEVEAMAQEWAIAEALTGGTAAMRAAKEQFLPRWPNETQDSYQARLKTATLFPAFSRTVGVMSGKPFSKQVTLSDDVPEIIKDYCENVDLEGRNLHAFASDLMQDVMAYGLAGVLVDYPPVGNSAKTQAEEKALGARPYMVMIRHSQILGWKSQRVGSTVKLTQLRLAEYKEVDDGEFGTKCIKRVRVLEPGMWSIYEASERDEDWTMVEGGTTTLTEIPFVPFYGKRLGFMMGKSPLIDLAYLNVKHWQSQSDQDTLLHVARVPILAVIGVDDENWQLTVGASAAVKLPVSGDLKFVEHTGAAIKAGSDSLEALEEQMIQTGAELLVKKPGERTATESSQDAEANKSDLQRIVETFEDSIDQALQFMADWIKLPEGGNASLFKDFGAGSLSDASAQLIITMQQGGLITKKTALIEQQRRGTLSPDIDPEEELDAVETEGPALGGMDDGVA